MQTIEPITIINVDNVPHAVQDMSTEVKRLVEFYNDWRSEEATAKSDLLKVQAAMRDLTREIVATIKQEETDAAAQDVAVANAAAKLEAEAKKNDDVVAEVPAVPVVEDVVPADAVVVTGDSVA